MSNTSRPGVLVVSILLSHVVCARLAVGLRSPITAVDSIRCRA